MAIEADITFNKNGVMTSGITHAAGTPGAAGITLVNAGDYKVTFSVSGTEPNQMALFVNGTLVPGTVYGSGAGTQQNTGQAIVTFAAGDVLTVRNHSSAAAVSLATPIGGTQANANASVVDRKAQLMRRTHIPPRIETLSACPDRVVGQESRSAPGSTPLPSAFPVRGREELSESPATNPLPVRSSPDCTDTLGLFLRRVGRCPRS